MGDYFVYVTFVLEVIFKVFVGILLEDPGSWAHIISTLTRQLVLPILVSSTSI